MSEKTSKELEHDLLRAARFVDEPERHELVSEGSHPKDPPKLAERIGDILRHEEELKLTVYTDTEGKQTIGYGRDLEDRGISEPEANFLLENDIAQAISDTVAVYPWLATETPRRQAVLACMAFQLGQEGLASFKKMKAAIEKDDFNKAADEMHDSLWAKQVPARVARMAKMMRLG